MAPAPLNNNTNGFVVLISVIVVGGISAIIATSLLFSGTTSLQSLLTFEQSAHARSYAYACGERALEQLKNDPTINTETEILDLPVTCAYSITNVSDEESRIQSTGTSNNVTKKIRITISKTTIAPEEGPSVTTLENATWQEVADF